MQRCETEVNSDLSRSWMVEEGPPPPGAQRPAVFCPHPTPVWLSSHPVTPGLGGRAAPVVVLLGR